MYCTKLPNMAPADLLIILEMSTSLRSSCAMLIKVQLFNMFPGSLGVCLAGATTKYFWIRVLLFYYRIFSIGNITLSKHMQFNFPLMLIRGGDIHSIFANFSLKKVYLLGKKG